MKRLRRVLLVIFLALLLVGFAAWRDLSLRQVADRVVTKIEALYGGSVKVASADIGLQSLSVTGLELFEKNAPPSQEPWLTIADLQTDISLLKVLGGDATPGMLNMIGAKVLLRFDKDGKLLTALPGEALQGGGSGHGVNAGDIPAINLKHGQVIIRMEGSSDLVFDNLSCTLEKEKNSLVLTGGAENRNWGSWTLGGQFVQNSDAIHVELKSGGTVRIDQAMLQRVPFVPAGVWQEVRIAKGDTPVLLNFAYDLKKKEAHYRVDLNPVATSLEVPAIALAAVNVRGKVTIEDQLVHLREVEGEAFAGRLALNANLEFGANAVRLEFPRITVQGIDVSRLPPSWDFPRQITGKLKGTASLKVVIPQGAARAGSKIQTEGAGKGQIVDAYIGGQATAAPIDLELRAVPSGFRFGTSEAEGHAVPDVKDERQARKREGFYLSTASELVLPFLLALQGKVAPNKDAPNKAAPKKGETSYLNISLKMKDVDLGRFEHDMNVKLPFYLAGKASFEIKVAFPLNEARDLRKYRLHGSAQLNQFVLGELKVESLETAIDFKDGLLRLSTLKGRLPPDPGSGAHKNAGTFSGSGSLQVEPVGDLTLNLTVNSIPLSLLKNLGAAGESVRGDLSGTMTAAIPGNSFKDTTTWHATAQLTSTSASGLGWTLRDASRNCASTRATWTSLPLMANWKPHR